LTKSRIKVASWLYLFIALTLIAVDQFAKNYFIATLEQGTSYPVIGDLLSWRLVYNDSAGFGLGFGYTWILAAISAAAALATIWYARRLESISWSIMTGIFLGGVVGNLIDRLIREPSFGNGHVVDFIQIPFDFPIFNLADIFIVSMAILTVIRVMRGEDLGGIEPKAK
jgi:signal peptidase II